jgi:hypothetical protein
MKLSAVLLARVLGFVETFDLNPKGKSFFPDLVQEAVKRYRFQKFPQAIEDFDETKGVVFAEGRSGDDTIQKLTIFNSLLVLETRSNTDNSKKILEEMLAWGKEKFDLNYQPGMIKRFAYVSDVSFYSDVPLMKGIVPLQRLAEKTGEALSSIWKESIKYEPLILTVGHDPTTRKNPIAQFTIQRRSEARLDENKYFSEAPLPTDVHLALLEQFEDEMRGAR